MKNWSLATFHNMRFEVIDSEWRAYVKYGVDLDFSIQDNGKTLKIFVKQVEDENVAIEKILTHLTEEDNEKV